MRLSQNKSELFLTRVSSVDVLTALCIVLVLLLHQASYTIDFLAPIRPFMLHRVAQRFAVGGFLFLSGYKLATSKLRTGARAFIVNRLAKIYVVYALSIFLFAVTAYPYLNNGDFPSTSNILVHLLAVQSVFPNISGINFHTLWFVSVLFFCYGCFLCSRHFLGRFRIFLLISVLIVLIVMLMRSLAVRLGIELFQYDFELWIFIFMLGMMYSRKDSPILLSTRPYLLSKSSFLLVMLALSMVSILSAQLSFDLRRILDLTLSAPLLTLSYAVILQASFRVVASVGRVIKWISGVSYFVFLLHRPIWSIMVMIWPERSFMQATFIMGFGFPLIFLSSFITQKLHASMLANFVKRSYISDSSC